jgi:hypothetical protein
LFNELGTDQMNDDDAAEGALVLDRVMHVADVTLEGVTHRKEVAAQRALEPGANSKNMFL